jgi:hypothetical protein
MFKEKTLFTNKINDTKWYKDEDLQKKMSSLEPILKMYFQTLSQIRRPILKKRR